MLIVSQIRTDITASEAQAIAIALRKVRLPADAVENAAVIKVSVDARHRTPELVWSVGLSLAAGEEKLAERYHLSRRTAQPLEISHGTAVAEHRPVVVGMGPAGLFCALLLAENGYRPIVLERGQAVEQRTADVQQFWSGGAFNAESNVQFGEGGAGTFSDGKLTTRISDARCEHVLSTLHRFGAPADILVKAKPHVGTDRLREVVAAMRREIIRLGGEVRFGCKVEGFAVEDGRLVGLMVEGEMLPAETAVLAIGHSARDTFRALAEAGISMEQKPFSVGVRIEHLQTQVDESLYGKYAGHPALPPGEYQLSLRQNGRAVYTFCMCPGGYVVPSSSEEGGVVVNGMSELRRDGANANSALAVSVDSNDFGGELFAGMEFQRRLEQAAYAVGGYRAPAQTVGNFLAHRGGLALGTVTPSYAIGVAEANLHEILPEAVGGMLCSGLENFSRKMRCFGRPDAVLTGVETRTSSPLRILRGEDGCSPDAEGLYPCGEGAGYAGGIVSAAVDGIRIAQAIMAKFAPFYE